MIGKVFGKLTVLRQDSTLRARPELYWICECSCGTIKAIGGHTLRKGETLSCGCYHDVAQRTHGKTRTRVYSTYRAMKDRCYTPKARRYNNYGGKGIKVCAEWKESFENFYKDMGERPPGKSLDRVDGNKDYSKSNCRWADIFEQNRNKRTNVWIDLKSCKMVLGQACAFVGILDGHVNQWRRKYGVHPQIAFEYALIRKNPIKYQEIYAAS